MECAYAVHMIPQVEIIRREGLSHRIDNPEMIVQDVDTIIHHTNSVKRWERLAGIVVS